MHVWTCHWIMKLILIWTSGREATFRFFLKKVYITSEIIRANTICQIVESCRPPSWNCPVGFFSPGWTGAFRIFIFYLLIPNPVVWLDGPVGRGGIIMLMFSPTCTHTLAHCTFMDGWTDWLRTGLTKERRKRRWRGLALLIQRWKMDVSEELGPDVWHFLMMGFFSFSLLYQQPSSIRFDIYEEEKIIQCVPNHSH